MARIEIWRTDAEGGPDSVYAFTWDPGDTDVDVYYYDEDPFYSDQSPERVWRRL